MAPVEVHSFREESGSLKVFAPCKRIKHRGDTLNTPRLTITYSSPLPDIIRVRIVHFEGALDRGPHFELNSQSAWKGNIAVSDDSLVFASGNLSVRVERKAEWRVDYLYEGRRISASSGCGYLIDREGKRFVREQLSLAYGECIYGLGERFTPFVKNGQSSICGTTTAARQRAGL